MSLANSDRCYCLLPSTKQLTMVRRGERGYYPVRFHDEHVFGDEARTLMDELNDALGVTEAEREAMHSGSIFGWDVPAANPQTWERLLARRAAGVAT